MREIRKRSRSQTMARILQAVGEVIAERGANRVGINAVAEQAGVNKVLIYRYFGGWEGLMQQFLQGGSFLTEYNNQFLASHPESNYQVRVDYLTGLLQELKNRQSAQDMLKWEISNPGSFIGQQLANARNESMQKIVERYFTSEKADLNAVTALLITGITMLMLMKPNQIQFMNINLRDDDGWNQIEQAIGQIYKALD